MLDDRYKYYLDTKPMYFILNMSYGANEELYRGLPFQSSVLMPTNYCYLYFTENEKTMVKKL